MNTIPQLIKEDKNEELMELCEQLEIQSALDSSINVSTLYPIYLASCVLTDDLQRTRYIRKRILKNNVNTPEIQAIWQAIVSLIKKSYAQVYQDLDSFQWTEYMQPLVTKMKQKIREHVFHLISSIYTSIELTQATYYFGLSQQDTLQELLNRGWKYQESNKILYPAETVSPGRHTLNGGQFERLADIVLNLEK